MASNLVKISLNLPKEELDFLKARATEQGTNVTQELRRAIATEKLVNEVADDSDARLLIDRAGTISEVLIK